MPGRACRVREHSTAGLVPGAFTRSPSRGPEGRAGFSQGGTLGDPRPKRGLRPLPTKPGLAKGTLAMRRVVVTGLGVVAPNGIGKEAFWSACLEGRSGVGPIRSFDASGHPVKIAAEVHDF